jgi:hypothetical protein
MIFISVLHTLQGFDAAKYVFASSADWYDSRDRGSVVVEQLAQSGKINDKKTTVFSWKLPDDLSGSVTSNGETQQFYAERFKYYSYRSDLNQFIENPKDNRIALRDAAITVEPRLEKFPLAFTLPGEMLKFYADFAMVKNWKVVVKDGLIHLTNHAGSNDYQFDFDANDFSLVHHSIKSPGVFQEWSIKPGPGLKAFSRPRNAFKVLAFAKPLKEPKYANAAVKSIVTKMFKAYDRPSWLACEIQDRGETTRLLLKGQQIRQSDMVADFSYDGETGAGAVWDKGGNTFYEGEAKSSEVWEAVAQTGTRLDPFASELVQGINPFRSLLSRDASVKVSMQMKDASGQPVTLLEVTSPMDKMNIAVRNSDGKVLSIMSGLKGQGDHIATQRVFTYLPKSTVDSASAFKVVPPANAKRRAVSDVVARK